MNRRHWAVAALALALCLSSSAAAWEYSAQIRPRMEARKGYRTPPLDYGPGGTWFVSQRTRLALGHRVDDKVSLFIQVQDVRTWGEESSTLNDYNADNFDVHQGYVELTPSPLWNMRIGRQELAYDGHRIMGNVNWTQQGRSHDAVRVALKKDEWTVHLAASHHEAGQWTFSSPYPYSGNYRDLVLLWAQYKGASYKASFIGLYDSYDTEGTERYPDRFTFGPRIEGSAGRGHRIMYRGEFYYQIGTGHPAPAPGPLNLRDQDIRAFLLGLRLGYDFGNLVLTGWYDYLSGDDDLSDDTYKAFDTPYPTNHKFYGWADYFLNIPDDTQNLGLQDLAVKMKVKKFGPLAGQLDGHYFFLAQDDLLGGKDLGWEIDASLTLPVTEGTNLSCGFSHVAPDEALARLKHGPNSIAMRTEDGNWGWVMLDVNVK